MYRMNDVLKLPPAMRILRAPAFAAAAAAAALSAAGSVFLAASAGVPNGEDTTKCLRSMKESPVYDSNGRRSLPEHREGGADNTSSRSSPGVSSSPGGPLLWPAWVRMRRPESLTRRPIASPKWRLTGPEWLVCRRSRHCTGDRVSGARTCDEFEHSTASHHLRTNHDTVSSDESSPAPRRGIARRRSGLRPGDQRDLVRRAGRPAHPHPPASRDLRSWQAGRDSRVHRYPGVDALHLLAAHAYSGRDHPRRGADVRGNRDR